MILSATGIYDKLYEFAGAGASVPLTGFGHSLVKGVKKAIDENGIFG
ncbi:MAG: SpoVA/SpoVAEb family sporulation membrane protein, partial [Clostridia bacterium]|nr:SpoVA/SpoVAEb family sporulation membrane protein [Clostridia bacterium]